MDSSKYVLLFEDIDKNILNYKNEELCSIHKAKILGTYFEGEKVFPLNK